MANLREKQLASLRRILQLNPDADAESTNPNPWKILIFDDLGRDVISSVMRVKELRHENVTMHLHISTTRHEIDAPAVYLVAPTLQNIQRITADLSSGLYATAYINFISSVPRPLLEQLGELSVAAGTVDRIAQVYDQHLNFVVSEPDLFHLNLPRTFRILNAPTTSDAELDEAMDTIVSGLFSVVTTLEVMPIIRCPSGGPAEVICSKLDRKLRDFFLSSKSNSSSTSASRPVLIIVDRNVDLTPMFSHSWIYQSLVYDVLDIHLNKINMSVPVDKNHPEKGGKQQSFDLTAEDSFWDRNRSLPFPEVADNVGNEWNTYQLDAEKVTKRTGASSIDDLSGESQFAAHLKDALSLLPELRDRKAMIEKHMTFLESVMEKIKSRKLDYYFEIENELSKQTKSQILNVLKDSDKGTDPMDKLRLFLQFYLTIEQDLSRAELSSFIEALEAAGAHDASDVIQYIRTVRQLSRMTMLSSAPTQSAQNTSQLFGGFSSLSSRVTERFKEAGLSSNFEGVLSGIKNYLPTNTDGTLNLITQSLMDPSSTSSSAISKTESYLYFDPRSANARGTIPPASQSRNNQSAVGRGIEASFGQRRQGYSEAIVFTVGGGSMDEYNNIQEFAQRHSASAAGTGQKRIVYGSTYIYNAAEFITQELAPLGKEST